MSSTPRSARAPSAARCPGSAAGVAIAGVIALAFTAHVLWLQFRGPQSVPNGPFSPAFFSADLAGIFTISPLSLAGSQRAAGLVTSPAEYTSFFGWPLVLVMAGATMWLWRRPAVVASAVTAMAMCALALGPQITINHQPTGHSGLYKLVADLPMLDNALPTRFALAAIPPIAFILATAVDAALAERTHPQVRRAARRRWRADPPGAGSAADPDPGGGAAIFFRRVLAKLRPTQRSAGPRPAAGRREPRQDALGGRRRR